MHHKEQHKGHGHKKHGHHPHDKMAAMPQFNEGHWEHKCTDVDVGGTRYSSEFDQDKEYKHDVDSLAHYAKKHKPKY